MLNINIICIGKLKESYLKQAIAEYSKRLGAFCRLSIIELSEYAVPSSPSTAQIKKAVETEGNTILGKIKQGDFVTAMCIEGDELSSEQLALKMESVCLSGVSTIDFVIGGSFGLDCEVKKRANLKLSMSRMTFPHQLARVLLLEQIYRAFQINTNGKYHK